MVICLNLPARQAPVPLSLAPPAALAVPEEAEGKMLGGRPCIAASAPTPTEAGRQERKQ